MWTISSCRLESSLESSKSSLWDAEGWKTFIQQLWLALLRRNSFIVFAKDGAGIVDPQTVDLDLDELWPSRKQKNNAMQAHAYNIAHCIDFLRYLNSWVSTPYFRIADSSTSIFGCHGMNIFMLVSEIGLALLGVYAARYGLSIRTIYWWNIAEMFSQRETNRREKMY